MLRDATLTGDKNVHKGEFSYADNKGSIKAVTVTPEGASTLTYVGASKDVLLFYNNSGNNKQVFTYDVKTKVLTGYQGKYGDKLDLGYIPVTGDGLTAISLRGADNKQYTMLLDKNMRDAFDSPVLGVPYAIADSVLYTSSNSMMYAYDMSGNLVAEIASVTFPNNRMVEEGVIVANQKEFLKANGTPAFEKIAYAGGKLLTLPAN